ncbi:Methenyltetrahydrofolate synthase domain-containing protein [Gryllus bimaculatus]|nr:Methenyltetrahydrofolate synthase domain-containing protein [Gryllus bimaculatus]
MVYFYFIVVNNTLEHITKESIRKQVWDYLEKHNLALFPRPVHGRIPNFKGSEAAAQKLADLEVFRNAKCIKISPDKPQEPVRRQALQLRKEVLMPIPRLRSGLFVRLTPHSFSNDDIKYASTINGAKELGRPVGLDAVLTIDILILGSVAVSSQGFRIGKGEGFADLEYAILMEMGAINESTPVITTVHDCQVFEDLPQNLFKEHDTLVDIIVTPTRVIHTTARTNNLPRPHGVIWSLLTPKQVADMPILQILRKKHISNGELCSLKSISYQLSLRITNIPKTTRVRELKDLLASNGIKPSSITWHGATGSAILHYDESHGQNTHQVNKDHICSVLNTLKIGSNQLRVNSENVS